MGKRSWNFQPISLSSYAAPGKTLSKISMILVDWESKLLYFGKSYLNSVWIFGKLIYLWSGYFLFESDSFIQIKVRAKSWRVTFPIFSAKVDLAFLIFSLAKQPFFRRGVYSTRLFETEMRENVNKKYWCLNFCIYLNF